MHQLTTGQFYGKTNKTIELKELTLTDTEYTHEKVDWHYHENAYFTFILQGNVIEGNKKEIYNCSAGTLLFHNWHDPHYNIKPKGFTRGFHIEIKHNWFDQFCLNTDALQGSSNISNPHIKLLLYKVFMESKISDHVTEVSIQGLLLKIFSHMVKLNEMTSISQPSWVKKVAEILNDSIAESISIELISTSLGIHPVHLSRDFSKYFDCNLGDYLRKLKIEKSLSLLSDKNLSLTEIAYRCGFSDQSHFIRWFKKLNGLKPSLYRKILLK